MALSVHLDKEGVVTVGRFHLAIGNVHLVHLQAAAQIPLTGKTGKASPI